MRRACANQWRFISGCPPAGGKVAAFEFAGHRHVPLAAHQLAYMNRKVRNGGFVGTVAVTQQFGSSWCKSGHIQGALKPTSLTLLGMSANFDVVYSFSPSNVLVCGA
jgi:hypothetical protein